MNASNAPSRLRAVLAEPGLVVMPAVYDGLSAKLCAGAGFKTAFLSGSCVAASRLGGPDLDLLSFEPAIGFDFVEPHVVSSTGVGLREKEDGCGHSRVGSKDTAGKLHDAVEFLVFHEDLS